MRGDGRGALDKGKGERGRGADAFLAVDRQMAAVDPRCLRSTREAQADVTKPCVACGGDVVERLRHLG